MWHANRPTSPQEHTDRCATHFWATHAASLFTPTNTTNTTLKNSPVPNPGTRHDRLLALMESWGARHPQHVKVIYGGRLLLLLLLLYKAEMDNPNAGRMCVTPPSPFPHPPFHASHNDTHTTQTQVLIPTDDVEGDSSGRYQNAKGPPPPAAAAAAAAAAADAASPSPLSPELFLELPTQYGAWMDRNESNRSIDRSINQSIN
jgi:hypothetical protein